jgi:hypothetical protein
MVNSARLAKSAEVGPDTSLITFRVSVPQGHTFTVVVRCDTGQAESSFPGVTKGAPCSGASLAFLNNGCDGGNLDLMVRVLDRQPGKWGVALYTEPDGASAHCR